MEAPAPAPTRPASEAEAPGGRLLIIDDEPMILGALRRSFASDYNVTCVGDGAARAGAAARRRALRRDPVRPDDARDDRAWTCTPSWCELAPEQAERLVFVTGGAFTPRAREFLERVPNARVEKPIDFQNLKLLLRNLRR